MKNKEVALSIKNLNYSYLKEWTLQRKTALKNINLEVYSGESFGFLGHNGAGKTTTIKCILGLLKAKEGHVQIFGKSYKDSQARAQVGYLPEQPYFYDYLSVAEILQMYATLAKVAAADIKNRVKETLELVRLSARSKSPLRTLSKGLTQRLAMAQAIIARPRMLILDEPFSGLDPIGRKDFRELLAELKKENTTIFMSSHILSDVEFLCDRVSIMSQGEIKGVFDLSSCPELDSGVFELLVRHSEESEKALLALADKHSIEDKYMRLSFKTRENAEEALRKAMEIKAGVESFEFVSGNLEDLFVKLVSFEEQRVA